MAEDVKTPAEEQEASTPQKKEGKTVVLGAKAKKAEKALSSGMLKITLHRALTGRNEKQRAIAYSLGLRRRGDVTIQPDNEATQGKIAKIAFLLTVSKA